MSNPKFEITNPEAIKLINDLKSGVIFAPVKAWLTKYKWYWVSGLVVIVLLISLDIGKSIADSRRAPVFLPPDLGTPVPTTEVVVKSDYQWIRQNILNYSTELPDPVIPVMDNQINLQIANK